MREIGRLCPRPNPQLAQNVGDVGSRRSTSMKSSSAISGFDLPATRSRNTSCSRVVKPTVVIWLTLDVSSVTKCSAAA